MTRDRKPKSEGRTFLPEGPASRGPQKEGGLAVCPRKISVRNEQGGNILSKVVRGLVTQCFTDPLQTLLAMRCGQRALDQPPNLIYACEKTHLPIPGHSAFVFSSSSVCFFIYLSSVALRESLLQAKSQFPGL